MKAFNRREFSKLMAAGAALLAAGSASPAEALVRPKTYQAASQQTDMVIHPRDGFFVLDMPHTTFHGLGKFDKNFSGELFDAVALPELKPENEQGLRAKLDQFQAELARRGQKSIATTDSLINYLRSMAQARGYETFDYSPQQQDIIQETRRQLTQHPEHRLIGDNLVFAGVGNNIEDTFTNGDSFFKHAEGIQSNKLKAIFISFPDDEFSRKFSNVDLEELLHLADRVPPAGISRTGSISSGLNLQGVAADIARLEQLKALYARWTDDSQGNNKLTADDKQFLEEEWIPLANEWQRRTGRTPDSDLAYNLLYAVIYKGETALRLENIPVYQQNIALMNAGNPQAREVMKSEYMVKTIIGMRDMQNLRVEQGIENYLNPYAPEMALFSFVMPNMTQFIKERYIPQVTRDIAEIQGQPPQLAQARQPEAAQDLSRRGFFKNLAAPFSR